MRRPPLRGAPVAPILVAAALLCLAPCGFAQQPGLMLKPPAAQTPWGAGLKAVVIGACALGLTFAGLRRWRPRPSRAEGPGPGLSAPVVTTSRRATQKTVLLVVHWHGKAYLLSETGQSVQVLDSAPLPENAP